MHAADAGVGAAELLTDWAGSEPRAWTAVTVGAYSQAARWLVDWPDGRSAFVKVGTDEATRLGVRTESLIYSSYAPSAAPFLPRLLTSSASTDDSAPIVVLEDLRDARWTGPLSHADTELIRDAINGFAALDPPAGLEDAGLRPRWTSILEQPAEVLATGMLDPAWLNEVGPILAEAERDVSTVGDRLVHGDLFRQNWCITGRGAVFVDWTGAAVGNPVLCLAWAEAAVRAAGGPASVVLADEPGWAAWMAGLTAVFLADHPTPPPARLLETERREAFAALCWAADEVGARRPEPRQGVLPTGPWRP